MWLNLKFAIQFSFNSIQKNFLRSLSIIISIVLIISTTVTMLGWLDESPKKAVEAAFENRGFEIKISEVYYHEGGLETLGDYLKTEAIVENISIIHRSIFLYNLDNRSSNFSVLNPPVNESDFYISKDDLSNGVFFIPNYHLNYIKNLLQFEPESKVSFVDNDNRSQVIISHRMLSLIEERMNQPDLNQTDTNQTDTNQTDTNQTDTNQLKLTIGSAINFSIATQFLPRYHEELTDLNPVPFENLIIGAIYDRIPSESQVAFGLDFYHETVGDGLFISNELLTENLTSQIEENGFFPTLFVRLNRTYLTNLPLDQVTTQINHLSARIHQQGRYKIEVQIDEINSMLHIFSQSYVVLLLMLFPILLLAEIFYLALVPHLINSRVEEFFYLRLRGTSDRKMMIIEGVEFAFLTSIGLIFGLLGGEIFLDILLFTNNFLQVPLEFLYAEGRSLLDTQNETLLIGVTIILLVNLSYFFFQFQRLLRRLEEFKSEKRQTRSFISKQSFSQAILKLLICGLILYLLFTIVAPILLNEAGASDINMQLIPLVTILLMFLWVIFSFYFPQFSIHIFQTIFDSMKIFTNPRRRLTWINLFRRRNQFIGLLALITMTISLFSFTIVWQETMQKNSDQNAAYAIGGDYKLITNDVNSLNFSAQLENSSIIDHCIGLPHRTVTISRYSIILIGIEPDAYVNVTDLYPKSIVDGSTPNSFWHTLNEDPLHSIIINNYLSDVFKWKMETIIQATELLVGYGAEWNLTVKGILSSAPGVGLLYTEESSEGLSRYGGYAFVHKDLLEAFGTTSANIFLIRLNNETLNNPNSTIQESFVMNQLKEMSDVRAVISAASIEKNQQNFFHLAGVQGILTIDALGSIIIAVLGVSVFYQYLINERSQELAIFQAFGATRQRIVKLAFIESLFLIILGVGLGVLTGNLLALGFLSTSRTAIISPNNIFLLEMTLSPLLLGSGLIIVTAIIVLAALIPLRKIFSLEITHLLREL